MVDAGGGHGAGSGESSGGGVEELGGGEITGARITGAAACDQDLAIGQKCSGVAEARSGHSAGGRGEGVRGGIVKFRAGRRVDGGGGESASDQNIARRRGSIELRCGVLCTGGGHIGRGGEGTGSWIVKFGAGDGSERAGGEVDAAGDQDLAASEQRGGVFGARGD